MNGENGERRFARPQASVATLIQGAILIVMLAGGGVALMGSLGDVRKDIGVLQAQVMRSEERRVGKECRL